LILIVEELVIDQRPVRVEAVVVIIAAYASPAEMQPRLALDDMCSMVSLTLGMMNLLRT
jgi:hypothetical protein